MKILTHKVKGKIKPYFCFEIYDLQQDGFVNLVFGIFGNYLKFTWEFDGYIYRYRFSYNTKYGNEFKNGRTSEQKDLWKNIKLWLDIQTGKKIIIGSWLYQKVETSRNHEVVKKYWRQPEQPNISSEEREKYKEFRQKSLIRINNFYYELIDQWGIQYLQNGLSESTKLK